MKNLKKIETNMKKKMQKHFKNETFLTGLTADDIHFNAHFKIYTFFSSIGFNRNIY